jgi:hypothetical protein
VAKARVAASVLVALIVAGAVGLAVWWSLTQLQKEVAAALVAAFGGVLVLVVSRYFEQRRSAEAQVREKKAAIYEEFISFWIELLMFKKDSDAATEPGTASVLTALSTFTKGVLIYGSDAVVAAWSRYRRRFFAAQAPEQLDPSVDPAVLLGFETVLLSIRKEFGHANRGLARGDLLGLFVNDVDVLLRAEQQAKRGQSQQTAE